jgi:hypothetical protein
MTADHDKRWKERQPGRRVKYPSSKGCVPHWLPLFASIRRLLNIALLVLYLESETASDSGIGKRHPTYHRKNCITISSSSPRRSHKVGFPRQFHGSARSLTDTWRVLDSCVTQGWFQPLEKLHQPLLFRMAVQCCIRSWWNWCCLRCTYE